MVVVKMIIIKADKKDGDGDGGSSRNDDDNDEGREKGS